MLLSVSLCVLMVSAVWAQGMNGMIRLDNVTACNCMPDNYTAFALEKSAYLGTGSSDPVVIDGVFTMDFSYSMNKSRLVGIRKDPSSNHDINSTTYIDYSLGKAYVLEEGSCKERILANGIAPLRCGNSANANYFGSYKLGSTWVNAKAGLTSDGLVQQYFHTSQDCQPIAYVRIGDIMRGGDPNHIREMENWVYANYKPNVFSEPDPFTMPAICTMGAPSVGKRSADTEVMIETLSRVPFPTL